MTHTLQGHPSGMAVARLLAAAFNAVEPGEAVKRFLQEHPLPRAKRCIALGLGKAACAMTDALSEAVDLADILVITKHASLVKPSFATVIEGNHPIPGNSSLAAGRAALDFVSRLSQEDLLVCLISGGGSALMTAPLVPLPELQALTSTLLACGARIDEINTLRRHLDLLKGGGLAQAANGARIISLILSDVVGDPVEAIASGPTAADPSTLDDASAILRKYDLDERNKPSILDNLRETAKPGDPIFGHVENHVIAGNRTALGAARRQAEAEGFQTAIIQSDLQGEAWEVGRDLATRLSEEARIHKRPLCLLAGGETTVTLQGSGRGGRNQELVLGAVEGLSGMADIMMVSIATDGEDGPTDAAGALATHETARRAHRLGLDPAEHLSRNDAYVFFEGLGDLIKTGPSGTNVNDLVFCLSF